MFEQADINQFPMPPHSLPPRLRVLEHKQIRLQISRQRQAIHRLTRAQHRRINPRPAILDQQFQPQQIGEMSRRDLLPLPATNDIVRQVDILPPVLLVDDLDVITIIAKMPHKRTVTRPHHLRGILYSLQPAEPNPLRMLVGNAGP